MKHLFRLFLKLTYLVPVAFIVSALFVVGMIVILFPLNEFLGFGEFKDLSGTSLALFMFPLVFVLSGYFLSQKSKYEASLILFFTFCLLWLLSLIASPIFFNDKLLSLFVEDPVDRLFLDLSVMAYLHGVSMAGAVIGLLISKKISKQTTI